MKAMNYWAQSNQNIYVAAHRGASTKYPENTMLAFRKAGEMGVDQIETDVRVTKDGHLVLIHDETVDRTTNGSGKVCDMTLGELRALDAGAWKGEEFAGLRIPLLTEFLEYAREADIKTIDIELKETPTSIGVEIAYDVCDRTLRLIEEYGFGERFVINSFNSQLHEYIREKYGDRYKHHVYFPAKYNYNGTVDPYSYAYCCCMFGEPHMATSDEFEMMRQKGIRTWAGAAVKDEETVQEAIDRGAELITCNNPDEVLRILREKGCHE